MTNFIGLPGWYLAAEPEFSKRRKKWYFTMAYGSGSAEPHTLPDYIFRILASSFFVECECGAVYYNTYKSAKKALKKALKKHILNEIAKIQT
jgi:hypothetical protein